MFSVAFLNTLAQGDAEIVRTVEVGHVGAVASALAWPMTLL